MGLSSKAILRAVTVLAKLNFCHKTIHDWLCCDFPSKLMVLPGGEPLNIVAIGGGAGSFSFWLLHRPCEGSFLMNKKGITLPILRQPTSTLLQSGVERAALVSGFCTAHVKALFWWTKRGLLCQSLDNEMTNVWLPLRNDCRPSIVGLGRFLSS